MKLSTIQKSITLASASFILAMMVYSIISIHKENVSSSTPFIPDDNYSFFRNMGLLSYGIRGQDSEQEQRLFGDSVKVSSSGSQFAELGLKAQREKNPELTDMKHLFQLFDVYSAQGKDTIIGGAK